MPTVNIPTAPSRYSRVTLDHSNSLALPKLSKGARAALKAIKDNVCNRSNVMTISVNQLATLLKSNVANVRRTIRTQLTPNDLVKMVTVYGAQHLMLNPRFKSSHATTEVWYMDALYHLGDHQKAFEFRDYCRDNNLSIDPETGEVLGDMNPRAIKMYHDWIDNYDNGNHVQCSIREANARAIELSDTDEYQMDFIDSSEVGCIDIDTSNIELVQCSDNLNRYYMNSGELTLKNRYLKH